MKKKTKIIETCSIKEFDKNLNAAINTNDWKHSNFSFVFNDPFQVHFVFVRK